MPDISSVYFVYQCNSGFRRTEKFNASTRDRTPVSGIPGEYHNHQTIKATVNCHIYPPPPSTSGESVSSRYDHTNRSVNPLLGTKCNSGFKWTERFSASTGIEPRSLAIRASIVTTIDHQGNCPLSHQHKIAQG